ncbi:MAG TPA: MATE family efflux transporter [Smithellaceae bacterium]|nr:MATE family efflux transporter [Smithellaceae bacterium]
MKSSQKIVLNTAATYTRSVIAVALSLFSSRWIFNGLGQTDYGIFSVVGSLIIFIFFFNNLMAHSAGRHYAFAIGQGDTEEVNRWFNTAVSIHLCFAVILTIIGWPIGEYFIANILNIPAERLATSLSVYRVSLIAAFIGVIAVPFTAMFTAKQRITELAVWSLLQTLLIFILAWCLNYVTGDKLLFYAICMVAIILFVQLIQISRAISVFNECKIDREKWFDKKRTGEIFSFAGWNLIGNLGGVLRDQGTAILLNLFFGPKVNAAYGIANQVSNQTTQLSGAMMGAFMPEITSSEGRGDRQRMLDLSLRACKLGTILIVIFAVPLIIEMDYVLKLWLINPPMHAALFCQLILFTFLIDRLSGGYMLAVHAHGKIAAYQATVGTVLVLTLPLAWLFLKIGFSPPSVGIAFVITMVIIALGRVYWVRRLFDVPVKIWFMSVLIPVSVVTIASAIGALIPRLFLSASLMRLLGAVIISLCLNSLTAWFFALDFKERTFIKQSIKQVSNKLKDLVV